VSGGIGVNRAMFGAMSLSGLRWWVPFEGALWAGLSRVVRYEGSVLEGLSWAMLPAHSIEPIFRAVREAERFAAALERVGTSPHFGNPRSQTE
jgi:hypothetical protein